MRALEAAAFPHFYGTAVGVAASAFGPSLLALGHDRLGTYDPALNALLALPLIAAGLVAVAPDPNRLRRQASPLG